MSGLAANAQPFPGQVAGGFGSRWPTRRTVSAAASLVVVLLGAVILAGWLIASEPLKTAFFSGAVISPNTGLSFSLIGVVGLLSLRSPEDRSARLIAGVLIAAVAALAMVTLVEYATHRDLGVDRLLCCDASSAFSGRISVGASIGLLLLAAAGLTLQIGRLRGLVTLILGVAVATIAWVSLLGYLFGSAELIGLGDTIPISLPGAVALALLAISMLANPRVSGPLDVLTTGSPGGRVGRAFLAAGIVALPALEYIGTFGARAGLSNAGFGVGLMTAAAGALLAGVGVGLGRSLDKAEQARIAAGQELLSAIEEQGRVRALLAAIVESTDDAVVSTDRDGRVLVWNRGSERLYGYPADEALGRVFTFLIPPEGRDEAILRLEQIRSGAALQNWETVRVRRDGRRISVSITISPVHDAAGQLIGEAVLTRDITELKAARDQVEAANAALTARNAELRDFASFVSHDLRAPLRRLQLFAEMAAELPGKDAEVSDLVDRIRSSAGGMEALVVDLLTYARVGASVSEMRPVDLAAIVGYAVEEQQSAVKASHGLIEVGELPTIDGDPVLLRQLFANLVGNAVKFAKPGVPPVVNIVGALPGPDAAGRLVVEITVRDNGIGFDPEYAERIFRIFERLSTDHPGTGVGLAICKKIVDLHGGTIQAISKPGEGATFTVRLPIEHAKELSDA